MWQHEFTYKTFFKTWYLYLCNSFFNVFLLFQHKQPHLFPTQWKLGINRYLLFLWSLNNHLFNLQRWSVLLSEEFTNRYPLSNVKPSRKHINRRIRFPNKLSAPWISFWNGTCRFRIFRPYFLFYETEI